MIKLKFKHIAILFLVILAGCSGPVIDVKPGADGVFEGNCLRDAGYIEAGFFAEYCVKPDNEDWEKDEYIEYWNEQGHDNPEQYLPSNNVKIQVASQDRGKTVELEWCYDGDTCRFTGFEESVRFACIDTPEKNGNCHPQAMEAKKALVKKLKEGTIYVKKIDVGYYGRPIGEVYVDNTNINDWMLEKGYAYEYGKETCNK